MELLQKIVDPSITVDLGELASTVKNISQELECLALVKQALYRHLDGKWFVWLHAHKHSDARTLLLHLR